MLYRLVYSVLQFLKRHPNFIRLSVLAVVVLAIGSIVGAKKYQRWDNDPDRGAIGNEHHTYEKERSTPEYLKEKYSTPRYLEQGWEPADSLWFYTTSQGSALMPYDFFLSLKKAGDNDEEDFRSDQNMDRFRYLPQKDTYFNPDRLPVGFVKETYKGKDYIGLTCAACHTSQINYKDPAPGREDKPADALRIDGGPAMADMVGFLTELEMAMKAAQKGKKNKDFVASVRSQKNHYSSNEAVNEDLKKWTKTIELYNKVNESFEIVDEPGATPEVRKVEYGYARLDAFGRIYNRVLQHAINGEQVAKQLELVNVKKGSLSPAKIDKVLEGLRKKLVLNDDDFSLIIERLKSPDPGYPDLSDDDMLLVRSKFFNSPNAPVSYPFLWDIAHSDYVQWNGVASNAKVGPLGRNAGEVIGVFGILEWGEDTSWFHLYAWFKKFSLAAKLSRQENKKEVVEFNSSINLFNLQRLESSLRSLKSPEWPFCRNDKGEYYIPDSEAKTLSPSHKNYCAGKDKRFDEKQKLRGRELYIARCQSCHTVVDRDDWHRVVVGNMIKLSDIGTDPAMAENSVNHKGNSGNFKNTYQETSVGEVVVEERAPALQILTAATKGVVATPDHNKWFFQRWAEWIYTLVAAIGDNTIYSSVKKGRYDPDTMSAPYASLRAYRARSLNGIWATAPYLHNGSVRTLYDLLLPPDERQSFQVGAREFDPKKVGFVSKGQDFKTDNKRGNGNKGHEYGTDMSEEARLDLIEYLRSL